MGAPKQKWTSEEESALKAGVLKHGPGKWRSILKDPQFSRILYLRSNVDLKDKWRNMSVLANGWGNRERARLAIRMNYSSSRLRESSRAHSIGSQSDEEIGDGRMHTASGSSSPNGGEKTSVVRLEILILEAISDLREPGGSNKSSIAAYIEDQYWAPPNFKRILSAKLKQMAAMGKLVKMNRKYRISPASTLSEGRRNPSIPMAERQLINQTIGEHDLGHFMEIQNEQELAKMSSMTPEEAAAAAAEAVAEAEAAVAEAEEAEREAVAAEAEAEAAQKFAEAALKTAKEKRSPAMNAQMIPV